MRDDIKPIAITMGEPAGIGGELTVKAWAARHEKNLPVFFAIDDPARLETKVNVAEISAPEQAAAVFDDALPVLPVRLFTAVHPGILDPKNAGAALESIQLAVNLAKAGQIAGLVTNPIHKGNLQKAGFTHPGHTEYIADLVNSVSPPLTPPQAGGKRSVAEQGGNTVSKQIPVMMLAAQDLRVVPLTIHVLLSKVASLITKDLILHKSKIVEKALREDFGIAKPHIVVAGLNPHAGEHGQFGREEIETITPAIRALQGQGLKIDGPFAADTLFHADARATYDAAICMYHDQALIPLKTLDFYGGVNITLGLSIIRTSPDHGTALDIAGRGIARPDSLIAALKAGQEIAQQRSSQSDHLAAA